MSDFKEMIKAFVIDLITTPSIFLPVIGGIVIFVLFMIACQRIRITDKRNGVGIKPGTKARAVVASGAIPGVKWPEPRVGPGPSMIVEPPTLTGPGMTGQVKKIVFIRTQHGHMINNGPDTIDLTDKVKSVSFGPEDTRPIEVTSDGEARRQEHRSEPDQDRDRARADRRTNAARRSRSRRRAPRRERRPEGTDES